MFKSILLRAFVVLAVLASSVRSQPDQTYLSNKELVYSLGENEKLVRFETGPKREHFAAVIRSKNDYFVVSDLATMTKKYDKIMNLNFNPDGSRLAVTANKGNKYYVIVDGVRSKSWFWIDPDTVSFSADGSRFAYSASDKPRSRADKDFFVVVDGKKQRKYHSIVGLPPTFNPITNELVYFARRKNDWFIVRETEEGQHFDQTGWGPVFSYDGSQVAYLGVRDDSGNVIVNDSIIGTYYDCANLTFSPTNPDFAYSAKINDTTRVILNSKHIRGVLHTSFSAFSPDGKRFAYWDSDGSVQRIVVDSRSDSTFRFASPDVRFSPGGKHYHYGIKFDEARKQKGIVIDGELLEDIDKNYVDLWTTFSPDDDRFSFSWTTNKDTHWALIDGMKYGPYLFMGNVTYSPDSRRVGFVFRSAADKQWRLFLDGAVVPEAYPYSFQIAFSADGKDLARIMSDISGRSLMINNTEYEKYGNIFPEYLAFESSGKLIYYAVVKDDLFRVTMTPQQQGDQDSDD